MAWCSWCRSTTHTTVNCRKAPGYLRRRALGGHDNKQKCAEAEVQRQVRRRPLRQIRQQPSPPNRFVQLPPPRQPAPHPPPQPQPPNSTPVPPPPPGQQIVTETIVTRTYAPPAAGAANTGAQPDNSHSSVWDRLGSTDRDYRSGRGRGRNYNRRWR